MPNAFQDLGHRRRPQAASDLGQEILLERLSTQLLPTLGEFDLIFADTEGGKTEGLDLTLSALALHGTLIVDDMNPKSDDAYHAALWPKLQAVRERLVTDPAFVSVEMDWVTGAILSVRRARE